MEGVPKVSWQLRRKGSKSHNDILIQDQVQKVDAVADNRKETIITLKTDDEESV